MRSSCSRGASRGRPRTSIGRSWPCAGSVPPRDRDEAEPAAGHEGVEASDDGHHHVEHLELHAAEVAPLEDLAVQEPAGDGEMVEVLEMLQRKAGALELP